MDLEDFYSKTSHLYKAFLFLKQESGDQHKHLMQVIL